MKEESGSIAYYAQVFECGLFSRFRAAHIEIFRFLFNNVHNKGASLLQVNLLKKGIQSILDANHICTEIKDYYGRGGYRFIECQGVKVTLHPFSCCGIK